MNLNRLNIVLFEDSKRDADHIQAALKEALQSYSFALSFHVFFTEPENLKENPYLMQADLVVLDMEIGKTSGIVLGKKLRQFYPNLTMIIVSGYTAYLEKGYTIRAARYFLKPLNPEILKLEMQDLMDEPQFRQHALISDPRLGDFKIRVGSVAFIEYRDRKCVFHLTNGHRIAASMALFEADELVCSYGFSSPAKGYLVNLAQIQSIEKDMVLLKDGSKIPVSRRRCKPFQSAFEQWNRGGLR